MTKAELITQIKHEREQLNALLLRMTTQQMTQPGVCGEWSVKDMLAHLAGWCARAITLIYEAERDAHSSYPQSGGDAQWTRLNQQDWETQHERALDRVLADFRGTHEQLLKRLDAIKEEALLFDTHRWSLRNQSLAQFIIGDSGKHDAEHRAQIENWLATQQPN